MIPNWLQDLRREDDIINDTINAWERGEIAVDQLMKSIITRQQGIINDMRQSLKTMAGMASEQYARLTRVEGVMHDLQLKVVKALGDA